MSALSLRIIAILCMLIDHIGVLLPLPFPWLTVACRAIGRLSFPLFAFLIANGYRHTRRPWGYALRLFVTALLSEPIFDLTFSGKWWSFSSQNVFFTLLLGLLGLILLDYCETHLPQGKILGIAACILAVLAGDLLNTDYGAMGVGLILCFHFTWGNGAWRTALIALFSLRGVLNYYARFIGKYIYFLRPLISAPPSSPIPSRWELITVFAALAAIPLLLYNGKKGATPRSPLAQKLMQAAFYLFYPLHLLILRLL